MTALGARLAGGVWGHLVGDAIGVPYESLDPAAIDDVVFGARGSHGQPPGTWSDDGALMLALLDSLLPDGGGSATSEMPHRHGGREAPAPVFDLEDQARRAMAWWRDGAYTPDGDGRFDWGATTSRAMARLERGIAATEAGPTDDRARGNGSLMRILPLALVFRDRDATPDEALVGMAVHASAVTHGHPACRIACAVYALVARDLLVAGGGIDGAGGGGRAAAVAGGLLESAFDRVRMAIEGDPISITAVEGVVDDASTRADLLRALADLRTDPRRTRPDGRGFVIDSFWSAWSAFERAGDYREAIEAAVGLGHDTDTTAAIAGGLAGIRFGLSGIPLAWRRRMRGRAVAQPILDRLLATAGYRTSSLRPLYIDWLDLSAVPGLAGASARGGRLGMAILPGKQHSGIGGEHWRDLEADVELLREVHDVDRYLLLVREPELEWLGVPELREVVASSGIELLHHPVLDMSVPDDLDGFARALATVRAWLDDGRRVLVTCRAGLGRTGTAVACLLVDAGLGPEAAVTLTRAARPGTLERASQVDFVRAWARATHRSATAPRPPDRP